LICKSRSHICYLLLGFSLYLCNLYLNFFQITKGLRFNSYPISLPIFSSLPLAVNPVGMTTYYWCYFLQRIVYNLVTINSITTKFGIRIHQLSVYQISRQSDNGFVFYRNFHTLTKKTKTKKSKETSQLLKVDISKTPGVKFQM